jgi:hypothetical protein
MNESPTMNSSILLLLLLLADIHPTQCQNLRARALPEEDAHTATRPHYQSTTSFLNCNYTRPDPSEARVERAPAQKLTPDVLPIRPFAAATAASTGTMDIECEADGIVEECGLRGTDVGMFVCRQHNGESYTTCVLPDSGQEGDKCGCCSGFCPMQCKCPCEMKTRSMDAAQQGVWIQRVGDSARKVCVEPLDSMTRQLGNRYECGTC